MKKIVILAIVAGIGVLVFVTSRGLRNPPSTSETPVAAVPESEFEKSLRNPDPTADDLLREIELLREGAELTEAKPLESEPVLLPPARQDAVKRDFDLAALEARFLETLKIADSDERRAELADVAAFLAGRDNESAARFMKAILATRDQFTETDGYTFATHFVEQLASTTPAAAAEWAEILPVNLKYPAHQLLVRAWATTDPQSVESWMHTLGDSGLRANAIRMMSYALTTSDNSGFAGSWAQRLASRPDDGPRLSDVVVSHWASVDFDAAHRWASNLPNADDQDSAFYALAKLRAKQDPPSAAKWARDTLTGDSRVKAIQVSVVEWVTRDPASAAAWVENLAEPRVYDTAFDMIAIGWMKKDEAGARQWIESANIAQHRKDYVQVVARQ